MGLVFMNFIELRLEGGWNEILPPFEKPEYLRNMNLSGCRVFFAGGEAEIRLVEPEIVIRRFLIKLGAYVAVSESVVVFDSRFVTDELTVDEDLRAGKRLKI